MKLSSALTLVGAVATTAQYNGDIVQYWVEQSALLSNNTLIGNLGLQSPPSGWFEAIVQASVYVASLESSEQSDDLAFQQLAVSHAAHNSLTWVFHGTRNFANVFNSMATAVRRIGIPEADDRYIEAASIGREAAVRVTTARAGDGIDNFVNYVFGPEEPGVYQRTPGGLTAPDTPQARYLRTFGGLGNITRFRAPPPPSLESPVYEDFLLDVKARGEENSTVRSPFNTTTAYFWRENSVIQWNRFAINVLGDRWTTDVVTSAKFALQLNYALANAAIAGWDSKSFYNSWRPVTAIRRDDIWLPSGNNVTDLSWTPLLDPTPNHQEYTSTHACFGAAAGAVIKIWNVGDEIDILQSTNATAAGAGELTRPYTSIQQAVKENGDSRIFGGIHFQFASDVGSQIGDAVGRATVDAFEKGWREF